MVSPGGTLRRKIGPSKSFLEKQMQRGKTALASGIPADASDRQKVLDELKGCHPQILKCIENMSSLDKQYIEILDAIKDDQLRDDEQRKYDAFASTDDGYLMKILEAGEIADNVKVRIDRIEAEANQPPVSSPSSSSSGNPNNAGGASANGGTSRRSGNGMNGNGGQQVVRLPKINLPYFDGDIMKWNEFWSIYSASVHDHPGLSGIQKFGYLLPQLKGVAKEAIGGFDLADETYEDAVEMLKIRFDRAGEQRVSQLYAKLKLLPPSGTRPADQRRTLDACEQIFRQLTKEGEDLSNTRSLNVDFLSKFPRGLVLQLKRQYEVTVNSKLDEIREAVTKNITELEETSGVFDTLHSLTISHQNPGPGRGKPFHQPNRGSGQGQQFRGNQNQHRGSYQGNNYGRGNRDTQSGRFGSQNGRSSNSMDIWSTPNSTMATTARGSSSFRGRGRGQQRSEQSSGSRPASGGQRSSIRCYFCDGDHYNEDCRQYASAEDRKNRLTELIICNHCARMRHDGPFHENCRNFVRCRHCHSENDHTSALCRMKYASRNQAAQSRTSPGDQGRNNQGSQRKPYYMTDKSNDKNKDSVSGSTQASCASGSGMKNALFQTAKVTAVNLESGEKVTLRLALDTLSNRTYITDKAAKELKLKMENAEDLYVSVFGGTKQVEVATKLVQFGITERNGNVKVIEANTTRAISSSEVLPVNIPEEVRDLLSPWQRQNALADDLDDSNRHLDILIGETYTWDIITGASRKLSDEIRLIPTTLGMMLGGELKNETTFSGQTMLCLTERLVRDNFPNELGMIASATPVQFDYPDVSEYWNLESIGITDDPVVKDDDLAREYFRKTVYQENNRYFVSWPWKEENKALLTSNYDGANRRFRSLTARLQKDPPLLDAYREIIEQQVKSGIIEKIPQENLVTDNPTHYLPHHPVVKLSSDTMKVRIVYDGSSKSSKGEKSLNECLMRGPAILPDLCQCLMRFRSRPFAIISDIEKAFLQVGLNPNDRDVTRFFWYNDDGKAVIQNNLAVYRFCRVPFGVISSPFLLGATIQHHLESIGSEFAKNLVKDVYVDNVISGTENADSAVQFYSDTRELFALAGMNLREFCSNSPELMKILPEEHRIRNMDAKVLGMKWDSQGDDTLRILKSSVFASDMSTVTKRAILKTIASFFDPLGFYQPAFLPAKCLLQRLWNQSVTWDEPLKDKEILHEWAEFRTSISAIFDHRILRFVGPVDQDSTLVVFSDASAKAYSAAVYLRCKKGDGFHSNLIFSKSRLTPANSQKSHRVRNITIPRLELLGAILATRAGQFCREALNIATTLYFFIDSEIVLSWIKSKADMKRFVENRIGEIRKIENCEFRYVKTEENPADYSTRGKTAGELISDEMWWKGPRWLSKPVSEWPQTRIGPL